MHDTEDQCGSKFATKKLTHTAFKQMSLSHNKRANLHLKKRQRWNLNFLCPLCLGGSNASLTIVD